MDSTREMSRLHRECLKRNHTFLLNNLSPSVSLYGHLIENDVLRDEDFDKLQNLGKHESKIEAVSHFIQSVLPSLGPEAFGIFLEGLRETKQDHIAKQLEYWLEKSGQPKATTPENSQDQEDSSVASIGVLLNEIEKGERMMKIAMTPMETQAAESAEFTEGCYRITRKPRGVAVIINNVEFEDDERFPKRKGSEFDAINIRGLFQELHFTVTEYSNKKAQEMLQCLETVKTSLPESDVFVAIIMSHGKKNCVYGTDGEVVQIEDITAIFNGDNCQKLRTKPKIFFIQACEGDGRPSQHGEASMDGLQQDAEALSLDETDAVPTEHKQLDRAVITSTVEGDTAWRDLKLGSPFIRAIVAVFRCYAHLKHFADMILVVRKVMSKWGKDHGLKQICEDKNGTLSGKLYFLPGYPPSP